MSSNSCDVPNDVLPPLPETLPNPPQAALRGVLDTALSCGRTLDDPAVAQRLVTQLGQWQKLLLASAERSDAAAEALRTAQLLSMMIRSLPPESDASAGQAFDAALRTDPRVVSGIPEGFFRGAAGTRLLREIVTRSERVYEFLPDAVRENPDSFLVFASVGRPDSGRAVLDRSDTVRHDAGVATAALQLGPVDTIAPILYAEAPAVEGGPGATEESRTAFYERQWDRFKVSREVRDLLLADRPTFESIIARATDPRSHLEQAIGDVRALSRGNERHAKAILAAIAAVAGDALRGGRSKSMANVLERTASEPDGAVAKLVKEFGPTSKEASERGSSAPSEATPPVPDLDRINLRVTEMAADIARRRAAAAPQDGIPRIPGAAPGMVRTSPEDFRQAVDEFLRERGIQEGHPAYASLRDAVILNARSKIADSVLRSREAVRYVAGTGSIEAVRDKIGRIRQERFDLDLASVARQGVAAVFSGDREVSGGRSARMYQEVSAGRDYSLVLARTGETYDVVPVGGGYCRVTDPNGVSVDEVPVGRDIWKALSSARFARANGLGFFGDRFGDFLELAKRHVPELRGVEMRPSNGFDPNEQRELLTVALRTFGLLKADERPTLQQLRERFVDFSKGDKPDRAESGFELAARRSAADAGKAWFRPDGHFDYDVFARDFAANPLTSR